MKATARWISGLYARCCSAPCRWEGRRDRLSTGPLSQLSIGEADIHFLVRERHHRATPLGEDETSPLPNIVSGLMESANLDARFISSSRWMRDGKLSHYHFPGIGRRSKPSDGEADMKACDAGRLYRIRRRDHWRRS